MKTAFSIVTSESEENELYCKALQVIDNVPHSQIDAIHNYYLNLLVKRKFKEHDVEKCFKIFKIKYRFDCIKYIFLGVEILKIKVFSNRKEIIAFGCICFKKYLK